VTERASATAPGRRENIVLVAIVVMTTTMTVLPVWLTGGLSVFMSSELAFDERELGFGVAGFFVASALASVPGGRLAERIGPRRSVPFYTAVAALVMVGMSFATSWTRISALLILGGLVNGMIHPSVNLALARQVDPGRKGLAFGIKQSAIPSATLLAGLAVPSIAATAGWRPAFQGAAILAAVLSVLAIIVVRNSPTVAGARPNRLTMPMSYLVWLTVAAALGAAAGNAMAAFIVPSAVASGITPSNAGIILVIGSVSCIIVRVYIGWQADFRVGGHLRVVGHLLVVGAIGYGLLSLTAAPGWVVLLGGVLGFSAGWGWAGLFNYAIVERNPDAPATATGIIAVGIFGGAVFGPALFGSLVTGASYQVAWISLLLIGAAGAVVTYVTRARLMTLESSRRG
jgi:MFS family permease